MGNGEVLGYKPITMSFSSPQNIWAESGLNPGLHGQRTSTNGLISSELCFKIQLIRHRKQSLYILKIGNLTLYWRITSVFVRNMRKQFVGKIQILLT